MPRALTLALLLSVGLTAVAAERPLTDTEKGIVRELNAARQNPKAYAQHLVRFRTEFQGNKIVRGNVYIRTHEGLAAVDEAIKFLRQQRPLKPLAISAGLTRAARLHANEQAKTGKLGHAGSNGSKVGDRVNRFGKWQKTVGENIAYGFNDPRDIVMQLIIDDGVADRGHRKNIFKSAYRRVGIANATHPQYRHVSVHVLAGGFKEKR